MHGHLALGNHGIHTVVTMVSIGCNVTMFTIARQSAHACLTCIALCIVPLPPETAYALPAPAPAAVAIELVCMDEKYCANAASWEVCVAMAAVGAGGGGAEAICSAAAEAAANPVSAEPLAAAAEEEV